MKRCPVCGVDEYNMKFEGYLCIDCYRTNRNDKHKEDVIKKKRKGKNHNLLEETCEKATSEGLTYAQYQIRETKRKLRLGDN